MKHLFAIFLVLLIPFSAFAGSKGYHSSAFGHCGNVTGGGNATPTLVSTLAELESAMTKSGSAVIIITKDIEFTTLKKWTVSNKTLLALPGVKMYNYTQNQTNSGILYLKPGSTNVIMRNLTFLGPGAYDCDGNDGLCFDGATNVWVDHCDFEDGCDGNFDNKGNTDNITVSWCKFWYQKEPKAGGSGGAADHRFTNLIGNSDTAMPADKSYTMTWAYCWWAEGCKERMPRVRNADLHLLNCVWTSSVANYYVGPYNTQVRFDGCYFGSLETRKIFYENYGGTETNAALFNKCTSETAVPEDKNTNLIKALPYTYDVLDAATAKADVTNETYGAGATLNVKEDGTITEGGTTSIETIKSETVNVQNRKYIQNGQIIIVKDGKKYNVAGAQIK